MSKMIHTVIIVTALLLTAGCMNRAKPSNHATEYNAVQFHAKGQRPLMNSTDSKMRIWVDAQQKHAVTELRSNLLGAHFYRYEAYRVETQNGKLKLTSTGELLAESYKTREDLNARNKPAGYVYHKPDKGKLTTVYRFAPKKAFELKITDSSYANVRQTNTDAKFQPLPTRLKELRNAGVPEIEE